MLPEGTCALIVAIRKDTCHPPLLLPDGTEIPPLLPKVSGVILYHYLGHRWSHHCHLKEQLLAFVLPVGVRGPTVAAKEIVVTLCYLSGQLSTKGEGSLQ